jgi:hypothetical protein
MICRDRISRYMVSSEAIIPSPRCSPCLTLHHRGMSRALRRVPKSLMVRAIGSCDTIAMDLTVTCSPHAAVPAFDEPLHHFCTPVLGAMPVLERSRLAMLARYFNLEASIMLLSFRAARHAICTGLRLFIGFERLLLACEVSTWAVSASVSPRASS